MFCTTHIFDQCPNIVWIILHRVKSCKAVNVPNKQRGENILPTLQTSEAKHNIDLRRRCVTWSALERKNYDLRPRLAGKDCMERPRPPRPPRLRGPLDCVSP